ncbi:hypothetical protein NJL88_33695 [Streptomyces sp. DK15]|uniref:hypothetical protein n=1 Tax=Streptomyces sp. DK15 TaxID=2957499 RepID=UPI0029A213BC|nr:hypothetical protein [Streptomyces sp. DK15]MDX2394936.1 hypothetical protein [Streptomyces sp. DK15]
MSRTRGTWTGKGMWLAGIATAAVLALTGYGLLSGDGGDGEGAAQGKAPAASPGASQGVPSPAASYEQPKDWTEPQRWAVLPRGQSTDAHGSKVGFPHTKEGAIAMMLAGSNTAIGDGKSAVSEQLRVYRSYFAKADQTPEATRLTEEMGQSLDESLAKQMGGKPGKLPPGAYMRTTAVGFKVVKQSENEVGIWVLSLAVGRGGETEQETSAYTRNLYAAQWTDGDWKATIAATQRVRQETGLQGAPEIVAPGDAAFNQAGWTALREAS